MSTRRKHEKKDRFTDTYGVLIVRPRTAGTREIRAAAKTVSFMVGLGEYRTRGVVVVVVNGVGRVGTLHRPQAN